MKVVKARQAAIVLVLGSLFLSLLMFVGVNRKSSVLNDAQVSEKNVNLVAAVKKGEAKDSDIYRIAVPPRFQPNFQGLPPKFSFNVSTFKDANKKALFLRASASNRKLANRTKPRKKKKMERYLIEYSRFQDNEKLREKALIVENDSKNVNRKVWFHKEVGADGSSVYDDGIVDQLAYVPQSYVKKLNSLKMVKFSKQSGYVEKKEKLERYLKNELKQIHRPQSSSIVIGKIKTLFNQRNSSIRKTAPAAPDWKNLLKVIYLPEGLPSHDLINRVSLSHEGCSVSACHLTDDPAFKNVAHARVFQNIPVASAAKPTGQIWVLWLLESPVNTFIINDLDMQINWTATFRRDSTIVSPYAKYVPANLAADFGVEEPNEHVGGKSYAAGKTKLVAWFASNCFTTNNRIEFVKELAKYVQVDVFGKCGNMECSKDFKEKCYDMLSSEYKFYLAFENSNCDFYITEKLFENALGNNIVPIVMGARRSDYERSAPPHSFIHVDDFETIEQLADYLKVVDNNDTLYDSYLAWRGSGSFIDTKFWCRLCALLQDDDKPNLWYGDIEAWWKHHGTCRTGKWSFPGDGRVNGSIQ